jgi:phosphoribosylglycinamide formyltransferase 1
LAFRLAVLVSGSGTNLQAILDTLHGREGIEVACVASNKAGARGLQRAQQAGVETGVFAASEFGDRETRDAAMADWLDEHEVQLVVLAGFMELLSAEFVRRFEGRLINVHPSLLPAFRGVDAIGQALEYGARVSGVTVHFVDEGVDSGPIIMQVPLELPYPADMEATEARVHEIEHELLPRVIRLIAQGSVRIDPANPRHVLIDDGNH